MTPRMFGGNGRSATNKKWHSRAAGAPPAPPGPPAAPPGAQPRSRGHSSRRPGRLAPPGAPARAAVAPPAAVAPAAPPGASSRRPWHRPRRPGLARAARGTAPAARGFGPHRPWHSPRRPWHSRAAADRATERVVCATCSVCWSVYSSGNAVGHEDIILLFSTPDNRLVDFGGSTPPVSEKFFRFRDVVSP